MRVRARVRVRVRVSVRVRVRVGVGVSVSVRVRLVGMYTDAAREARALARHPFADYPPCHPLSRPRPLLRRCGGKARGEARPLGHAWR